ncbi:histidine phosphatase family protein [Kurthia senegalensis]|uniref:histidine phosphatase family protein n=1 Tax=Kurthia senegalensis TaxID=1033740 RepID=UPI000289A91B|nr:histidine phosphatase family protein [Kurthia senegalensis]
MDHPFVLELMRHGKTVGNDEKRYVGWTDDVLLTENLPVVDAKATYAFCSDLQRTVITAKHYFPNANVQRFSDFRESHFGDFEMQTYEQLKDNPRYRAWIDDPYNVSPPNGETLHALFKRVEKGIQQLPKYDKLFGVLHGGTIRAILVNYAPKKQDFWAYTIGHNERYVLTWDSWQQFKEGQRCTSLSVELLTAKKHT